MILKSIYSLFENRIIQDEEDEPEPEPPSPPKQQPVVEKNNHRKRKKTKKIVTDTNLVTRKNEKLLVSQAKNVTAAVINSTFNFNF